MIAKRQHAVKARTRPARTSAGDALTDLVIPVVRLAGGFTAAGDAIAGSAGQTLARWVVLELVDHTPATVAQVARARGYARQSVQRVADLLVRDGLAVYEANPDHRRAMLLRPTDAGRSALATIAEVQRAWADAVGAEIGAPELRAASAVVARLLDVLGRHPPPVD